MCTRSQPHIYIHINPFVFPIADGHTQLQASPGLPPEPRVSTLGHNDWLEGPLPQGHPLHTTVVHPEHAAGLPHLPEEPGH